MEIFPQICPYKYIYDYMIQVRGVDVYAPILKSNSDFILIFLTVPFYPYFLKSKVVFTLVFNLVSWMALKNIK